MLLILLSWLYILAVSLIIGVSLNRMLRLKNQDSIITLFFGFFGVSLIAGFWAIPFAINGLFHVALLSIAIILGFINRKRIIIYLQQIKSETQELTLFFRGLLFVVSILILAQC